MTLQEFKQKLALVFDDNTKTVVWKNYVDYAIWALIALSTIEIFLSTYSNIVEKYGFWLEVVDIFTTIFFTIEVSLRIWTIDLVEPKYQGLWGRVRYCLSFYGFIDFVSTYSYYINFLFPLPLAALKCIRVARLLRVFRFMRSFRLLTTAISSKSKELLVSLQFLVIITTILSFILFFAENEAQPEIYSDGLTPVIWAFMQYIGDPGGFGEYPPITFVGRIIACIIGVLGIAIFAVPAGLIGSGFTEAIEEESVQKKNRDNANELLKGFYYAKSRKQGFFYVPRYRRMNWIQTKTHLSIAEIISAVGSSNNLRLKDLGTAIPTDEPLSSELVVECFPTNRPYGCYIDRKSKITIVATSSFTEPCTGTFAFYLAKIGGFNYMSREYTLTPIHFVSYFNIDTRQVNGETQYMCPRIPEFLDDIRKLSSQKDSLVIFICASDARVTESPSYPTKLHYVIGQGKNPDGEPNYNCEGLTLKPEAIEPFERMYREAASTLNEKYNVQIDVQKNNTAIKGRNIAYHLKNEASAFTLRVACSIITWDADFLGIAQCIADSINKEFNADNYPVPVPEDMLNNLRRFEGEDYRYDFYKEIEENRL